MDRSAERREGAGQRLTHHRLFARERGEAPEGGFPFVSTLSFAPVIAGWRDLCAQEPETYEEEWRQLEGELDNAPELTGPIHDPDVLSHHARLVSRLLGPLFPGSGWSGEARALTDPFGNRFTLRTRAFDRILGDLGALGVHEAFDARDNYTRILYAYRHILKRYYDVDLRLEIPIVFVARDSQTGLSRYYKFIGNTRFVSSKPNGPIPELGPSDIADLFGNLHDLGYWLDRIPPDRFEFEGVNAVSLTDVTNETAIASITDIVLESDAHVTEENFDLLEQEVRNLFGVGTLRLGLASIQGNGELNFESDRRIWNSLAVRDAARTRGFDWRGTVYGHALRDGRPVSVANVSENAIDEDLRSALTDANVGSLFVQPLRYDDRMVGLLELSAPEALAVDNTFSLRMDRVETIFALAVFQNLERFEQRVESAVQSAYTAIHSSVAWRFREAAIDTLERARRGESSESEPVLFEGLYPLYGSADIRGSTRRRNEAARDDIVRHLEHARDAIRKLRDAVPLTILGELDHRVARRLEKYEATWTTGDETEALRFISGDVEPVLESVLAGREGLEEIWSRYRERTGEGAPHAGRAAYDESVRRINGLIARLLHDDQEEAQRIFPHYFDYAKTDGVEHTLYVGQSIAPERPFDRAYVQDLRLRQLMLAARIEREVAALNADLDMPLDVVQLILAQDSPVTLRFRTDEKRFDLEGASGIRFEMLKKRLDKACVKGTKTRITQPGHVAIVYTLEREREEYLRYCDYLLANGLVRGEPDVLEIEDLPGASGLHLLRVEPAE